MKIIRAGLIKRIHVDQYRLRKNHKEDLRLPVLTVQARNGPYKGHKVLINGASELIYAPKKPLSCGARVWIQTTAEVVVEDELSSSNSHCALALRASASVPNRPK